MAIYNNTTDKPIRVGMQIIAPGSKLDLSDAEAALATTRAHVESGALTTRAKVAEAKKAD